MHLFQSPSPKAFGGTTHLYCPKVAGEEEDDCDHATDEAAAQDLTQEEYQDGSATEEQMKEGSQRVPETAPSPGH